MNHLPAMMQRAERAFEAAMPPWHTQLHGPVWEDYQRQWVIEYTRWFEAQNQTALRCADWVARAGWGLRRVARSALMAAGVLVLALITLGSADATNSAPGHWVSIEWMDFSFAWALTTFAIGIGNPIIRRLAGLPNPRFRTMSERKVAAHMAMFSDGYFMERSGVGRHPPNKALAA